MRVISSLYQAPLMVLYLYVRPANSALRRNCSSEALRGAPVRVYVRIYVCSNGVETEAMLEHGATGGRSCYKTCHFLSSSKRWPIHPHIAGKYRLWPAQGQSWNTSNSVSWWIYVGLLRTLYLEISFDFRHCSLLSAALLKTQCFRSVPGKMSLKVYDFAFEHTPFDFAGMRVISLTRRRMMRTHKGAFNSPVYWGKSFEIWSNI